MPDDHHQSLRLGVELLTLKLSSYVMDTDWSDPDAVVAADRMMRVLSAYGRNIEKCLAMTDSPNDREIPENDEREHLLEELHSRLVRYATRLGKDELLERLEERGLETSDIRLVILGSDGSDPTSGEELDDLDGDGRSRRGEDENRG